MAKVLHPMSFEPNQPRDFAEWQAMEASKHTEPWRGAFTRGRLRRIFAGLVLAVCLVVCAALRRLA